MQRSHDFFTSCEINLMFGVGVRLTVWEECRFSMAMLVSLFVIHKFRLDDGVFGFLFAVNNRHAGVGRPQIDAEYFCHIESLIQLNPSFAVMDMQGEDPTNGWSIPITAAIPKLCSSS